MTDSSLEVPSISWPTTNVQFINTSLLSVVMFITVPRVFYLFNFIHWICLFSSFHISRFHCNQCAIDMLEIEA